VWLEYGDRRAVPGGAQSYTEFGHLRGGMLAGRGQASDLGHWRCRHRFGMINRQMRGVVQKAAAILSTVTASALIVISGCNNIVPPTAMSPPTSTTPVDSASIAMSEIRMTEADVERVVAVSDRVARRFGMVPTPALDLAGYGRSDAAWSYRTLGYFPRGAAFSGIEGLAFAIVVARKKDGSELLVSIDELGRPRPPEFIRQLGRELRNELADAFAGYEINVRDRTWIAGR